MSAQAGVSDPKGYFGMGIAWVDVDDDGWPDLYVANDGNPNQLWINQKNGTFRNEAEIRGAAVNANGAPEAGMGVDKSLPTAR